MRRQNLMKNESIVINEKLAAQNLLELDPDGSDEDDANVSPSHHHHHKHLSDKLIDSAALGVKNKLSQYNFSTNKNAEKFSEAKGSLTGSVISLKDE